MNLPHGRELLEILPLSELYSDYSDHERLGVFANKGLECVTCPRVGTFLILSRETNICRDSRKRKSVGRVHIDIYTDDFILMTVDHIVPKFQGKALGWTREMIEALENKQPMCDPCNNSKGCKKLTNEQLRERRRNANNQPILATSVIRQLVPRIHELVGDYDVITT